VIEATGKQLPLDLASRIVQHRGKIIIAGCHHDGMRQVNFLRWNLKGIDIINAYEPYPRQLIHGMQEALTAIEQGRLDVTPLFSHYYTRDRIGEAFKMMTERPEGFMKAIVQLN
jgi:threonine dehydrogenase-like Zn-dependent dehydrogenase